LKEHNIATTFGTLVMMGIMMALVNYGKTPPWETIKGILIISCIGTLAWILSTSKAVPVKLPPVAYAGLLAILSTLHGMPWAEWVSAATSKLDFISVATIGIGFVGVGMGHDMLKLAKDSWKYAIVAAFVLAGTYFGSAIIAQIFLSLFGTGIN